MTVLRTRVVLSVRKLYLPLPRSPRPLRVIAQAIRDRAAEVTAASGILAAVAATARTEIGARTTAAQLPSPAPRSTSPDPDVRSHSGTDTRSLRGSPPGTLHPQSPHFQSPPPTGQVLRVSTALERQWRRSGSPEETIPAFGLISAVAAATPAAPADAATIVPVGVVDGAADGGLQVGDAGDGGIDVGAAEEAERGPEASVHMGMTPRGGCAMM